LAWRPAQRLNKKGPGYKGPSVSSALREKEYVMCTSML
jgi:hypothetical protein